MVQGFEEYTHQLTDYEEGVLLPLLVAGLKTKRGKINAITGKKIVETLKNKGYKITGPRVRKLVNFIRLNGLVINLISSSKGYFIATEAQEIEDYINSLKQREEAIAAIRKTYKNLKQWNNPINLQ
jgi:nucleoside-triphosphatase THEP1